MRLVKITWIMRVIYLFMGVLVLMTKISPTCTLQMTVLIEDGEETFDSWNGVSLQFWKSV